MDTGSTTDSERHLRDVQLEIENLGRQVDAALDGRDSVGLQNAIDRADQMDGRVPDTLRVQFHYNLSNAWANLNQIEKRDDQSRLEWENPFSEKAILNLRRGLDAAESTNPPGPLLASVLTNLANQMSVAGRVVEALEIWKRALVLDAGFTMSLGNRGIGLHRYGQAVPDSGHASVITAMAHRNLARALSNPATLVPGSEAHFRGTLESIEARMDPEALLQSHPFHGWPMGDSEEEQEYRRWCLDQCLFLNPLNDLGAHSIAARDILGLPNLVSALQDSFAVSALGLFNQIKQEYASARYLLYLGLHQQATHFSDRDVALVDTLDYAVYSVGTEFVKLAFRSFYSIFDKLAFFISEYLQLGIAPNRVDFRTLWYVGQKPQRGLRPEFRSRANWPLRGLFWLSKDLFDPRFRTSMEPDARELNELRNHLEHRYVKLHDSTGMAILPLNLEGPFGDRVARSISADRFERQALRLAKLARAAITYLTMAVKEQEYEKARARKPGQVIPGMVSVLVEDEWKVHAHEQQSHPRHPRTGWLE